MKTERWTEQEVKTAADYFGNSEHETAEETFSYVADMMCAADYPKRTISAYKAKLYKHWNKP